jgi:hypothetical protein
MSLPTMHHTDSEALPILQFTALRAVVRQRTLEIELEESPELLSEALFERCAPAPFWGEALLAASAPPKACFTAAEVQPTLPPDVCMPLREPLRVGVRARAHCNIFCRKSAAGKGMKASSGGAYNRVLSRYRHADTHMHYCSREMMVCRCCWEEREPWYSTLPPRSTTTVGKPLIWNA